MVRKVLIGVAAVVVLFLVIVATRPSAFHIERSVTIAAPAENAHALVNDFHVWSRWSPYEKLDPQMKRTFEGPASGQGAMYAWKGDKSGAGRMTIEKSDKPSLVSIKLEFTEPMAATNTATFTFVPTPEGTKATWAMDGKNGFIAKAFCMFMDMDKLVGSDFEKGLAEMKTAAEADAKTRAATAKATE